VIQHPREAPEPKGPHAAAFGQVVSILMTMLSRVLGNGWRDVVVAAYFAPSP